MINQIATIANIVPNGTAPEDLEKTRKKFKMKKTTKIMPGTSVGVSTAFSLKDSPPNVL